MARSKKSIESISGMLADIVINGMREKKAVDIVKLNIGKIPNSITDYFVICHATNKAQLVAIADSVEMEVKKAIGILPKYREGFENCEWVILDYFDVVVHIFIDETREFYQLEALWADADRVEVLA